MKSKLLIIMLLVMTLMAGCSESDSKSTGSKAADLSGTDNMPRIELEDYAAPKDWQVLNQAEAPVFTTDWIDFNSADNQDPIGYSISYPADWKLEYSVFVNKDGQKVAELIPPILLSQGQKPYDNWKPGYGEKLVSRREISLGDLSGQKIITETTPDDGPVWYPHNYCLAKDNKAFMIIFYERELSSGNEELFNKIVSTLKFR